MIEPLSQRVSLWNVELATQTRADGSILVRQTGALPPYPDRITDRLVHFAAVAGDRTWMAQRGSTGAWRRVSYAQALDAARRIGTALLSHGLSADRPILILSDNSLEHALIVLGAYYSGIPFSAISPAYSRVSTDFAKLRDIASIMTPGLVFADDGALFETAIERAFSPDVPVVSVRNILPGRGIDFASLLEAEPGPAIEAANEAIGPDSIVKFLFTSGSTGSPKPVIQTQRLICSNQAMVLDCYAFLSEAPPVLVDWAPWNHTASGNKVFNIALYNGGTYYIDEGKPAPGRIAETIRNLREIAPTWYFNVPAGYEMLADAMRSDAVLRRSFFDRIQMIMYAGAGMAQHTWDALEEMAVETVGHRVLLATGLGATETGPFAMMCTEFQERAGNVGVPAKGVELKLVPQGSRLEARLRGPSITPGYWRNAKLTAEAFDEEGYYRLGDALRPADGEDLARGFFFDGRLAENFKLATGTWVAVGLLRAALVDHMGGLVRDAVIAGENETEIGALLVPAPAAIRARVGMPAEIDDATLLASDAARALIAAELWRFSANATGSASRIARAILLTEPLSLDRGEITDKGSVNQRAVLRHRASLVEALYRGGTTDTVRVLSLPAAGSAPGPS